MKAKRLTMIAGGLVLVGAVTGCSHTNYENRPVPWVKAKVYQVVDNTGIIQRTYIRKPDYYSTPFIANHFQTCHNYYLNNRKCSTPVRAVPACQAVKPSRVYRVD